MSDTCLQSNNQRQSNFEALWEEALRIQNANLYTQVLSLKQQLKKEEKTKSEDNIRVEWYLHFINEQFGVYQQFLFQNYQENEVLQNFIKVIQDIWDVLNNQGNILEIIIQHKNIFNSLLLQLNNKIINDDKQNTVQQQLLTISELKEKLKEQEQLEDIKRQLIKKEIQLKSIEWKNLIYQQRISILQHINDNQLQNIIQEENQINDYSCFCGGKLLQQIDQYIHFDSLWKEIQTLKENLIQQEKEIILNSQNKLQLNTEQQIHLYEQIKEEIQLLINQNQASQIDNNLFSKKMIQSSIFQQVKQIISNQNDYIIELENNLQNNLKSLEYYQEITDRKYSQQITLLTQQKNKYRILYDSIKEQMEKQKMFIEQQQQQPSQVIQEFDSLKEKQFVQGQNIIKISSEIQTSLEHLSKGQAKEIRNLQEKIWSQQQKLIKYSTTSNQQQSVQNLDQNPSTQSSSSNVAQKLLDLCKDNAEQTELINQLYSSIKKRNKQLEKQEQLILFEKKNVEKEQKLNQQLLEEFEKLNMNNIQLVQQRNDSVKEIEGILQSNQQVYLSFTHKEKILKENIFQLNKEIQDLQNEINNHGNTNEILKQDQLYWKNKQKMTENQLEQQIEINQRYQQSETNLKQRIFENEEKLCQLDELCLMYKNQLSEISKELSKNILIIKEREFVIQNLIQMKTNSKFESEKIDYQSQYYIAKLEVERLKKQILCKNCNENEKEVVLLNCFHSFCQKCVDWNINERSWQCPICMAKFSKFDIKKLFIN